MNNLRKLLKTLEDYVEQALAQHDQQYQRHPSTERDRQVIVDDLEALRQALAEPEQEPVWIYGIPAFYAPPKREWVDLTEEEIRSFDFVKIEYGYEHECWVDPKSLMKFAKNILQAAKEKNT